MSTRPSLAAITCLLASACAASAQCVFSFETGVEHHTGSSTNGVVPADLDGDGHLDMIVADGGPTISVFLNAGDGSFSAPTQFNIGTFNARSIAAGDVNGDGLLDVVGAVVGESGVCVLLGDGAGGLGPASIYPAGAQPWDLVLGDFNGDGRLDAAVVLRTSAGVAILTGNGDGAFLAPVVYPVYGGEPEAIVAEDLDLDGLLDLATANLGDSVSVLWGAGTGGFSAPSSVWTGTGAFRLDAGLLNDDALPDIVVADIDTNEVLVLHGQGGRAFAPGGSTAVPGGILSGVRIAELNGDGLPDMAVCSYGGNAMTGLAAVGDGSFEVGVPYAVSGPWGVEVADLDGDDRIDVIAEKWNQSRVSVFFNSSSSYLAPHIDQQPQGDVVPAGTDTVLSVVASTASGLPISYQWLRDGVALTDGGNISGATTPALMFFPAEPGDAAIYEVIVSIPSCDGGTVDAVSAAVALGIQGSACAGDFNADGSVNTLDVIAFLGAWADGCP